MRNKPLNSKSSSNELNDDSGERWNSARLSPSSSSDDDGDNNAASVPREQRAFLQRLLVDALADEADDFDVPVEHAERLDTSEKAKLSPTLAAEMTKFRLELFRRAKKGAQSDSLFGQARRSGTTVRRIYAEDPRWTIAQPSALTVLVLKRIVREFRGEHDIAKVGLSSTFQ